MKKYLMTLSFLLTAASLFATDWTNTVLTEKISVKSYKVVSYTLASADGKQRRLVTREMDTDRGKRFYFIDLDTLQCGLTDRADGKKTGGKPDSRSFYGRIMEKQERDSRPYGSAGEFHAGPSNRYIVLTSDLCPTPKNFDSQFYSNLVSMKNDRRLPLPLVIFISGGWVMRHPAQLEAVKKSGIDFIAGNHTYDHQILNRKNTNNDAFTAELTNTETVMLEHGILPSQFFRYPGLVYNQERMKILDRFSMIAVNANVWMGTKLRNWGILLVHSNGCASSEVRVFASFLAKNLKRIRQGDMRFYSIYDYFREILSEPLNKD